MAFYIPRCQTCLSQQYVQFVKTPVGSKKALGSLYSALWKGSIYQHTCVVVNGLLCTRSIATQPKQKEELSGNPDTSVPVHNADGKAEPRYTKLEVKSSMAREVSSAVTSDKKSSSVKSLCPAETPAQGPVPSTPAVSSVLSVELPTQPSSSQIPSKWKRFFLGQYVAYLDKFKKSLENEMPDTFHMFRIFTVGLKEFVVDFRDYVKVIVLLSLPFYNLEKLTHHELELYYFMPWQMFRVFPVLAVSSLPFGQNIAMPIAYWFPKQLLSYHFWDIKQRHEFSLVDLKKRLFNARPVFRALQAKVDLINDDDLREICQSVFFCLGSGIHPTANDILAIKQLFSEAPYQLKSLTPGHVNGLLRLHGLSAWLLRRRRLREHGRLLLCLDRAIAREGIEHLTSEQFRNCLLVRGISPSGLNNAEMKELLQQWLAVSSQINESHYSLVLHLPILIAYNHPANLVLLHS